MRSALHVIHGTPIISDNFTTATWCGCKSSEENWIAPKTCQSDYAESFVLTSLNFSLSTVNRLCDDISSCRQNLNDHSLGFSWLFLVLYVIDADFHFSSHYSVFRGISDSLLAVLLTSDWLEWFVCDDHSFVAFSTRNFSCWKSLPKI